MTSFYKINKPNSCFGIPKTKHNTLPDKTRLQHPYYDYLEYDEERKFFGIGELDSIRMVKSIRPTINTYWRDVSVIADTSGGAAEYIRSGFGGRLR